ncbi:MAG: molybdopterin-dependent oxidoreductase [Desulfotomaculales bacterium]
MAVSIIIDGQTVRAAPGATVLEVALANGIYIPHLCHHPDLKPAGACRLCYVTVNGGAPVLACRTPAQEGMVVQTGSPEIDEIRRGLVELLMVNHHGNCKGCLKSGRCALQEIIAKLRIDRKKLQQLRPPEGELPRDTSNPFFVLDPNRCVLCGICVRTCEELVGLGAINFAGRGYRSRVAPLGGRPLAQSVCESCGECVERCPVAGLAYVDHRRPREHVLTVCHSCGAGCPVTLGLRDGRVVEAKGELCGRGRFGWRILQAPDRLTVPLIRRNGAPAEASWEEALDLAARELSRYRGGECAVLCSGRLTNEEAYLLQRFAREVLGTNNIDSTLRLTHAVSLETLREATGWGGATGPFEAVEEAACILLVGANVARSHPVLARRIRRAAARGARLVVVDPREDDLRRFAHLWLQPYPGTDPALLMGMAVALVEEQLVDPAVVGGPGDFAASLEDFLLGRVSRITGVPEELVAEAAKCYATSRPAVALWGTGLTRHPHGRDGVRALVSLALLAGHTGLYPLLEEVNAQGIWDMGCAPDHLPGQRPVRDPRAGKGGGGGSRPGLALTELWDAILEGKVRALYLVGLDPLAELPEADRIREALGRLELLVYQNCFLGSTGPLAHVVLPAAGWFEKEGTVTRADGRIARVRRVAGPAGGSRPDGEIICGLAARMGGAGFVPAPAAVLAEIASMVRGYGGLSWEALEKGAEAHVARPPLEARAAPPDYRGPAERPDMEYPLLLTGARNSPYGDVLSQRVEGLRALQPEECLALHPKDAADFGIADGDRVRILSRRGELTVRAAVADVCPPGVVVLNYAVFPGSLTGTTSMVCAVTLERLA